MASHVFGGSSDEVKVLFMSSINNTAGTTLVFDLTLGMRRDTLRLVGAVGGRATRFDLRPPFHIKEIHDY